VSERDAKIRQATVARFAQGLATHAHVSAGDVFDKSLLLVNQPRAPAVSTNLGFIEELTNLVEPRGEAFHDALILLQIGARRGTDASVIFSNPLSFTKPLTPLSHLQTNKRLVRRPSVSPLTSAEDRL
jgi:hypothetical protein